MATRRLAGLRLAPAGLQPVACSKCEGRHEACWQQQTPCTGSTRLCPPTTRNGRLSSFLPVARMSGAPSAFTSALERTSSSTVLTSLLSASMACSAEVPTALGLASPPELREAAIAATMMDTAAPAATAGFCIASSPTWLKSTSVSCRVSAAWAAGASSSVRPPARACCTRLEGISGARGAAAAARATQAVRPLRIVARIVWCGEWWGGGGVEGSRAPTGCAVQGSARSAGALLWRCVRCGPPALPSPTPPRTRTPDRTIVADAPHRANHSCKPRRRAPRIAAAPCPFTQPPAHDAARTRRSFRLAAACIPSTPISPPVPCLAPRHPRLARAPPRAGALRGRICPTADTRRL
jgi:hypothetical protein